MRRSAETAARAFRLAPLVALCIGCGAASPEAPGRVASTGATTPPVRAAAGPAAPATAPPAPAYTELPPEGPGPVPRVVSIAVARHGTCAVDDRGGVHCWGLAAPGPSRIRVRPERLRGIDDATAVVGGDYATFCLLRREHPTTCWEGAREEGPREIPELRPASADDLAVGDDVICALAAGRVSCVGSNGIDRTLPGDLEEVEALRVFRHSFFVRRARDRRTLCAGLPVYDQCLDGDTRGTGLRELPIDGVTDLWGDGSHGAVCARLRGGEVLCWGEGIRPSAPARHQPRRIPALRDAVRVVPFAASACGLVPGGQVRCVPFHDGPDRVLVAGGATALVAAESHACALVGRGEVRCWGDERLGRLGNDAGELVSRPRRVAGVDDAVRLVSAPSATYVLRRTGELSRVGRRAAGAAEGAAELEVVSTGAADDSVGLCGRRAGGTSEGEVVRWARGAPAPCEGFEQASEIGFVGSLDGLTCARFPDGAVRCRGRGHAEGGSPWVGYAAGDLRVSGAAALVMSRGGGACAILQAGGARCFGLPEGVARVFGLPADGGTHPVELPSGQPTVSLAWDQDAVCAVDAAGAWLCTEPVPLADSASLAPVHPGGGAPPLRSVVAGEGFFCALSADSAVRCTGTNQYGQLGAGPGQPLPGVQVAAGLGDVVELASGQLHTCARTRGGEVYCWGGNRDGQVGAPPPTARPEPVAPAW